MKRKTLNTTLSLFIGALLIIGSAPVVSGAEADLVKNYTFTANSDRNLYYNAPEEIEEDGQKYKLKEIEYEIISEPENVIRTVQVNDPQDLETTITEEINGEEILLTADAENIDWHETATAAVIRTQDYSSRSRIPESLSDTKTDNTGNTIEITLELTNVENISTSSSFSAPATFYSPTDGGSRYRFNGKIITVGSSPTWTGYEQDVKDYLGINGSNYNITGGSWSSGFTRSGDQYIRTATYTGTRTTPAYRATFTETDATRTVYTAEVAYTNGEYTVQAKAHYEKAVNVVKVVAIGAGILIVILAVVAILYNISKRRKEETA